MYIFPQMQKRLMLFLVFFFFLFKAQASLFKAQTQIDISLEYAYYITHTDFEEQLNHYMNTGLDFMSYGGNGSWFYGAELVSFVSMDKSNQRHLAIPDLFFSYKLSNVLNGYSFDFVLGRQKRLNHIEDGGADEQNVKRVSVGSWSFMDEVWNLGLWQGSANWDYFRPKQQGLIGSFFTISKNKWLLTLFLSGVFLPDQGPQVDIVKGNISSGSRWFVPPQSEFVIFSQRFESLYWLKRPYLKNVVLNDSIATRFFFGDKDGDWLNLAYAYKPVNQVYFKIDGGFSIDKKAIDNVIHYHSFKHSLVSVDFGIKKNIFKVVSSAIQNIPHSSEAPKGWIVPTLPKALFFSSYVSLDLVKYHLPIRSLNFNFLYSRFVNRKNVISDTKDHLVLDLSAIRFRLYRGFSLSAYSKNFHWKNQSFSLGLSYWYSIPEKGGWFNAAFDWQINSYLALQSEIDILGARDLKKESFFNTYRQNDRFIVKLIYFIN